MSNGGTFKLTPATFDIIFPSRFDSHVTLYYREKFYAAIDYEAAAKAMEKCKQEILEAMKR